MTAVASRPRDANPHRCAHRTRAAVGGGEPRIDGVVRGKNTGTGGAGVGRAFGPRTREMNETRETRKPRKGIAFLSRLSRCFMSFAFQTLFAFYSFNGVIERITFYD